MSNNSIIEAQNLYLELAMEQGLIKAREGLLAFTLTTYPEYEVNWHHKKLCQFLNRFARGEIKRAMVFMPPRHGKSELVSRRLPAFLLGRDPDASIIATSYSSDLASRMNRDVQRIMDSENYNQVFPDSGLNRSNVRTVAQGSWLRNSEMFEVVGRKGVYRSAGVGGGITGMGGKYIIIDDPIKNQEEAESPVYRDKIWDWYTSTLYTRLEKQGSILITLTRWHEDDLAGRLLKLMKSDPSSDQWEILNFPAIREDFETKEDPRKLDEALWPGKYDRKALSTIKSSVGTYFWNGLYQQRPASRSGGMFKRSWFQFYRQLPDGLTRQVQSWDLSFKDSDGSDFVCGGVWAKIGGSFYLIDLVRDRMDFTDSVKAIRSMTAKHPLARKKLIEDKANGPAVITTLKKEISGIVAVQPKGSKEARASAVSPYFEAGNVYIPDPSICSWVHDYIEEMVSFPKAANDDQVDMTSQALLELTNSLNSSLEKLVTM